MESVLPIMPTCDDCVMHFENYDSLLNHKNSQKEVKCVKCGEQFANDCELNVHNSKVSCHKLPLGCTCDVCGMGFENDFSLMNHKKLQQDFCKCEKCEEEFADICELNIHNSKGCDNSGAPGDDLDMPMDFIDVHEKHVINKTIFTAELGLNPLDSSINVLENKNLVEEHLSPVDSNVDMLDNKNLLEEDITPVGTNVDIFKNENIVDGDKFLVKQESKDFSDRDPINPNDFDFGEKSLETLILEKFFSTNPYPNYKDIADLSTATKLRERVVTVWFNKKRKLKELPDIKDQSQYGINVKWENEEPKKYIENDKNKTSSLQFENFMASKGNIPLNAVPIRIKKSKHQIAILEQKFAENSRPSLSDINDFSKLTDLTVKSIKVWFNNKRSEKKIEREIEIKEELEENPFTDDNPLSENSENNDSKNNTPQFSKFFKKSKHQIALLKQKFNENSYPTMDDIKKISILTGLTVKIIKIWFMNRRAEDKWRSENNYGGDLFEIVESDMKPFRNVAIPLRKKKTKGQIDMLESAFTENTHPNRSALKDLSESIGLDSKTIKVWFMNRRNGNKSAKKEQNIAENLLSENNGADIESLYEPLMNSESSRDFVSKQENMPMNKNDKGAGRQHRYRPFQRVSLENFFTRNSGQYPNNIEFDFLIKSTQLSKSQIRAWFQNKRVALKKKQEQYIDGNSCGTSQNINAGIPMNVENESSSKDSNDPLQRDKKGLPISKRLLLENSFSINPYPNDFEFEELRKMSGLARFKIERWFSTKRIAMEFAEENKESIIVNNKNEYDQEESSPESSKQHVLENLFSKNPYPDGYALEKCSSLTGLTRSRVQKWFATKRMAMKINKEARESLVKEKIDEEDYQIKLLEEAFQFNPHPDSNTLGRLVKTTKLVLPIIKTWFINRRTEAEKNTSTIGMTNESGKPVLNNSNKLFPDVENNLSVTQQAILENSFSMNPYPNYEELANFTGLAREIIDQWFANKRIEINIKQEESKEDLRKIQEGPKAESDEKLKTSGKKPKEEFPILEKEHSEKLRRVGQEIDELSFKESTKLEELKIQEAKEKLRTQEEALEVTRRYRNIFKKAREEVIVIEEDLRKNREESKEELIRSREEPDEELTRSEEPEEEVPILEEEPEGKFRRLGEEIEGELSFEEDPEESTSSGVEPGELTKSEEEHREELGSNEEAKEELRTQEEALEVTRRYRNISKKAREEVRVIKEDFYRENLGRMKNPKRIKQEKVKVTNMKEDKQIKLLEKAFKLNQHPNSTELEVLVQTTQLEFQVIKTWFVNKRATQQLSTINTQTKQVTNVNKEIKQLANLNTEIKLANVNTENKQSVNVSNEIKQLANLNTEIKLANVNTENKQSTKVGNEIKQLANLNTEIKLANVITENKQSANVRNGIKQLANLNTEIKLTNPSTEIKQLTNLNTEIKLASVNTAIKQFANVNKEIKQLANLNTEIKLAEKKVVNQGPVCSQNSLLNGKVNSNFDTKKKTEPTFNVNFNLNSFGPEGDEDPDDPDDPEADVEATHKLMGKPKKRKKRGCGECGPCHADECGKCVNCVNKKSRKQKCVERICTSY